MTVLRELLVAIWRIVILILLAIPLLMRWLFRFLRRGRDRPRKRPENCIEIPAHVRRRPDPCLYSQPYLLAQGLAVTWDNPDIWLAEPDGTLVPSGSLKTSHDYVVHARIHNASFDPAIATTVRCRFRDWGFSGSALAPVETDTSGHETFVVLHLPPWGSEIARYRWRTPPAGGHYCLVVECAHPEDREVGNNVGQENTNIVGAESDGTLHATAVLGNSGDEAKTIRFVADGYAIPSTEVTLRLDTWSQPVRHSRPHLRGRGQDRSLARIEAMATRSADGPQFVGYAYRGRERIIEANAAGQRPVEPGRVEIQVDGQSLVGQLALGPGEQQHVEIIVHPGLAQPINVRAVDQYGETLGGVTLQAGGP
jgi:hypothetical protein